MIGKGGGQNIMDVRFLKGVDLGITQSNLMSVFRQRPTRSGQIDDKIAYIADSSTRRCTSWCAPDSGITSIEQLAGKKVNFSDVGSGTQFSTRRHLRPARHQGHRRVNMGQTDALSRRSRRGDIAATILIAGKPTGSIAKFKARDGCRILPVPFSRRCRTTTCRPQLTHDDYPNLIEARLQVDTIAVGAVLIAYNWPRRRRTAIAASPSSSMRSSPGSPNSRRPPRHPKWREANLAATVPGVETLSGGRGMAQRQSRNFRLSRP